MFLLPERGSMSASIMQLHHFMFRDSSLVKSGKYKKSAEKLNRVKKIHWLNQEEK